MTDRLTVAKQVLGHYRLARVNMVPLEVLEALAWAIEGIETLLRCTHGDEDRCGCRNRVTANGGEG